MSESVVEMPAKRRTRSEPPKHRPAGNAVDGENYAPAEDASQDPTLLAPPSKPAIDVSRASLPMPPRFNCSPPEFFRYWESLKAEERARVIVYPYRVWPKMDYTRGLSPDEMRAIAKGEAKGPLTNLGPLSEPFPFESWREQILHLWGSGAYHLKLNDTGVRGDKNLKPRSLCQMNTGDVIDANYPPVLDLEKLDIFADTNASYIRDLKLKGVKIPGITEEEKENEDMAGAAAAETMAATVKDLTGQVVSLATQAHQQANRPAPVDVSNQAQLKASEIIAEASKESIRMVTEAARRDADVQDPNKHLQNVLAVAREIAPKPADTGMYQLMIEQMRQDREAERERAREERAAERAREERAAEREREFHRQQMALLQQANEAQLKALEARIAAAEAKTNPASTVNGPAGDQLGSLAKVFDFVLKFKDKINAAAEPTDRPWWAELVEPASQAIGNIAHAVETGMYNNAVAKTGNGTPAPPSTQPAIEIEGEEVDPYTTFWNQVKPQLTKALQDGIPGYVFGAQLALTHGAAAYNQLQGLGEQGIYQFISAKDQQFWAWTRGFAQQFGNFVGEFLQVEKVKQTAQELQITREEAAAPPEPPAAARPPQPRPAAAPPQAKSPSGPPRPQAVVDATKAQ